MLVRVGFLLRKEKRVLINETLLKPETFKVIDADIGTPVWHYIAITIIALTIVSTCVISFTKSQRRADIWRGALVFLSRLLIPAMAFLVISCLLQGNPFTKNKYKYVVAEVDVDSKCYQSYFKTAWDPVSLQKKGFFSTNKDKFITKDNKLYFYMKSTKTELLKINPYSEADKIFMEKDLNDRAINNLKNLYEKTGKDPTKLIFKNNNK